MRISEIHVYQKELPVVDGPYTMSTMTLHSLDTTIIKLVSDTGLIGWGEVTPLGPLYQPQHAKGARAAIAEMAPSLIGQNCLAPLLLRRKMDDLLNGHNYAKAGIDIALMDLLGKHYGLRVCDLLGGSEIEKVPAYEWVVLMQWLLSEIFVKPVLSLRHAKIAGEGIFLPLP